MTEDSKDNKKDNEHATDNSADENNQSAVAIDPEHKPKVPSILPVLPLKDIVLFPDMIIPLVVHDSRDIQLIDQVLLQDKFVAFAPISNPKVDTDLPSSLFDIACSGIILKMMKFPDNSMRLLVQGLKRVRIETYLQRTPYFVARTSEQADIIIPSVQLDAAYRSLRDQFNKLLDLLPQSPNEVKLSALNIQNPSRFADLVTANLNLNMEERCSILSEFDIKKRLDKVSLLLERELQIVELGTKIHEDVKQKINQGQREFFLREQLKAIRKELGDTDDRFEVTELEEEIKKAKLPEEAEKEAKRELSRLEKMQPNSAEYTVTRTYLDWLVTLPWHKETVDRLDIIKARKILDKEHYNLKKVKDRIIEFLAVKKNHPKGKSPILCFVGPPGVGKTSLGRSIAKSMDRKFERISLGGIRDEAEIRGHRRTYVGAMPGRIIQGLRRVSTNNPIFMLDEIDKLVSDMHGDPASAMLEVLDPEQNSTFRDHYLDLPFDLSKIIFITTANNLETIPPALRDRMEILHIAGYSEEEKLQIAKKHLIPKVLADHGVKKEEIIFEQNAILAIINLYTREAGLRNLEREIASIVRKVIVKSTIENNRSKFKVTEKEVKEYLGPPRYFSSSISNSEKPGVALGLSWSPSGGDVLFIETSKMPGKKGLLLTGRLGEVIKESAHAAMSWIKSKSEDLNIASDFFDNHDIHIHFPEGATPKDGPSAGITLVCSLVSLITDKPVKPFLAMTGEITLRGKVLPVGGIKEKVLAARRTGVKEVILPKDNIHDLDELPVQVRKAIKFYPIETIEEMIPIAFPKHQKKVASKNTVKSSNNIKKSKV